MIETCRYCGAWEVNRQKHVFCGGCGSSVHSANATRGADNAIDVKFDVGQQSALLSKAVTPQTRLVLWGPDTPEQRVLARVVEQGRFASEVPSYAEPSKSLYWRLDMVNRPGLGGLPSGVLLPADGSQNGVVWQAAQGIITSMEGLDHVPLYLHPSQPVRVGRVEFLWEQSTTGLTRKTPLAPLFSKSFSDDGRSGTICGPELPLQVAMPCTELVDALTNGSGLKYEVFDTNNRSIGGGAIHAKLSSAGKAVFALRETVFAWGEADTPARIPFKIANSGGDPIEIKDFACHPVEDTPAPEASSGAIWPIDLAASTTFVLKAGEDYTGELRPVPARHDAPDDLSLEVHTYKAQFSWRAVDHQGADWLTEEAFVKVQVNRRAGGLFRQGGARVCIDFGTTQSSAVLITGDLNDPQVRVLDLDFAGLAGIAPPRPFLDSVIAHDAGGNLVFGQDGRRWAKSAQGASVSLVEDSKWHLTSTERLQVGSVTRSYLDLVQAYLQDLKRRIEGHPDIGCQLEEVLITCPAQFGDGQKEALIGAFAGAGLTALDVSFPSGNAFISESWPPIVWALSGQADHEGEMLPQSGAHLLGKLRAPSQNLGEPSCVLDNGPLTPEQETYPQAVWALTFDMGGGSADVSALRITKRVDPFGGDEPIIEVADEARATSATRGDDVGFVGREFERLARRVVSARLCQFLERPGDDDRDPVTLLAAFQARSKLLPWQKSAGTPDTAQSQARLKVNAATIDSLATIMRLDTGPLDSSCVPSLFEDFRNVLEMEGMASDQARAQQFIQNFMDRFGVDSAFLGRVSKVIAPVQVWKEGAAQPQSLDLNADWWVHSLALLAGQMFMFQSTIDRVFSQTLLPMVRNANTTFVLSGRAGLFAPARAFAIAKFQKACDMQAGQQIRYLALDGDGAKLVTALGGAYMGRVFDVGNTIPAQFVVSSQAQLGIQIKVFVPFEEHFHASETGEARVYWVHPAKGLRPEVALWTQNRAGYDNVRVGILRLGNPPLVAADRWVVIERAENGTLGQAWVTTAPNAKEALELALANQGQNLQLDLTQPKSAI